MATRPSSHEVTCLVSNRRAIVVVARVARHDVRVALSWQGAHHVRKRIVSQPGHAVVVGLARPHPVAGDARVTFGATGALARVVPRGEEGACVADRKVRLPLRTGSGISVQLKWGTEGNATVRGTNVIDVARIGTGAVLGIDQVNNAVKGGRFTPTLVPPEATRSQETCR